MNKIEQEKHKLRKLIQLKKKDYCQKDLLSLSEEVMMTLEITGSFVDAKNILIYNSLSDEVDTLSFIKKWSNCKNFYLPVVVNNNIQFRKYSADSCFQVSDLGILEPLGNNLLNYDIIDLAIIPGVAFDRKKNRLGRGKGYYDSFLKEMSIPTIGICFDFQLLEDIPTNENDIKMDMIVSENDFIW